jgi:hypothetical protein
VFLTTTQLAAVRTEDSDREPYDCVPGLLAESLEEVKSVEPDTIEGRLRIKPERSGTSLHHCPIELPGFASEEVRNGAVRWHGTDEVACPPYVETSCRCASKIPFGRGGKGFDKVQLMREMCAAAHRRRIRRAE